MADLLTAVSTKKTRETKPLIQQVQSLNIEDAAQVDSRESVLRALKNEPSAATVRGALKYLTAPGFSLVLPEPLNASITHLFVNDTIPNYWRALRNSPQVNLIAQVLRNPTGIGHIGTRLRSLLADSQTKRVPGDARNTFEHIEDMLEVLGKVLHSDETSTLILRDVLAYGKNTVQKKLIWREYLAQAASGRLLALTAEAEDVLKKNQPARKSSWMADGSVYAAWLGRNVGTMMKSDEQSEEYLVAVAELSSKALGLGYTGKSTV